jgi:hypothetical protein
MKFSLADPVRVRRFNNATDALAACPPNNADGNTYAAIYSGNQDTWVVGKYVGDNLVGYLENDNA